MRLVATALSVLVLALLFALPCGPLAGLPQATALAAEQSEASVAPQITPAAEADTPQPEHDDLWSSVWADQYKRMLTIKKKAQELTAHFDDDVRDLNKQLHPFEEEARRLMVLTNTFRNWANPMEAISRRITVTVRDIKTILAPMLQDRAEAQAMLEQVSHLAESLPEDMHSSDLSEEMRAYMDGISRGRLRLTAVLAQYNSALSPALALTGRLEKTQEEINKALPELWNRFYQQKPVAYLSPAMWTDMDHRLTQTLKGLEVRLPVELPVTSEQITTALLRFFLCLMFVSAIGLTLYKRWVKADAHAPVRQIFSVCLPWLSFGLALVAASVSATGEFFRFLLAAGNLCLIMAEVYLAWYLRLLKDDSAEIQSPPLMRLIPLTLAVYVLLYMPLPRAIVLLIWMGLLMLSLFFRRKIKYGTLQLESTVLDIHSIILWPCLLIAIMGLHEYSMGLYLAFASLSLGLQLTLGGMNLVSRINEFLPQEGVRAALARLLVALAAPLVLVIAVMGVLMWMATLPGGIALLREYLFMGVDVGATKFDIVQLLLIISVFYLARTAVSMGSHFLAKLPQQGLNIDTSFIPPIQTAFTYTIWAFFGLFVLRTLGMELSNLAMVAGGLSVGIGFGMQTIVNNFLSGLILIFSRTLQAGDVVEVSGITGKVRKISVRATQVETLDNALIYVPNSEFVSNTLVNWTRNSPSVRRDIAVGVAYGSDTKQVMKILLDIAKKHDDVLKYPQPSVLFNDFGASTLDFLLRIWLSDYDIATRACSEIRLEIERQFDAAHIEISFPQMDVHIKEMPPRSRKPALPRTAPKSLRRHPGRRTAASAPVQGVQHKASTENRALREDEE